MTLRLLWNTVKYLKPVQIYGRIWYHLYQPGVPSLTTPSIRLPDNSFTPPIKKGRSLISPTRFRFLNQEHDVVRDSDWNNPAIDKLWLYNLHYFNYLNENNPPIPPLTKGDKRGLSDEEDGEKGNGIQQQIMKRWIDENPPFTGNGWESYPLSLRIVNWIKWFLAGNPPTKKMADSLYLQTWYLRRRLEFHLPGNHLLANAKALISAGLFFECPDAKKWFHKGLDIYQKEIKEQILDDGGHFERSPMYHSIILEDLLDITNIFQAYKPGMDEIKNVEKLTKNNVAKMRFWLKVMCHPDEQISFFNDAALGIAPEPIKIEEYALRLGFPAIDPPLEGITSLPDSGYVRLQQKDAVLIADVGKIGPDHLPGHAHADTLSFELSYQGKRVFVNSGTSCYGNSLERLSQRGTASHNTLTIDEKNSSEVWSSFRVAKRAYPLEMKTEDKGVDGLWLMCAHNGYQRLKGKPIHYREWLFTEDSLEIRDRISVGYSEARAFYHLYPGLIVDSHTKKISSDIISMVYETDANVFVENKYYYPEFGRAVPNKCLIVKTSRNECHIKFKWN